MAKKGILKQKINSTTSEELYPHTSADIVSANLTIGQTAVTDVQTALEKLVGSVNSVAPLPGANGNVVIDTSHIKLSGNIPSSGTAHFTTNNTVQQVLESFDSSITTLDSTAVKTVNGKSPISGAVTIYGDEISASSNDSSTYLIGTDGKIPLTLLPDVIVGQMVYGGTLTYEMNVSTPTMKLTLSTNAKTLFNTSSDTLWWSDVATNLYNNSAKCTGMYFIIGGQSLAPGESGPIVDLMYDFEINYVSNTLKVSSGDWIVYNGDTKVNKIDNTDSVTGVKGSAETTYRTGNVNLTPANLGISLTTTTGSEAVTVGSSTLNVVTRDTTQTISGAKTFSDSLSVERHPMSTLTVSGEFAGNYLKVGETHTSPASSEVTTYFPTQITRSTNGGTEYAINLPSSAGTLALTDDITLEGVDLNGTRLTPFYKVVNVNAATSISSGVNSSSSEITGSLNASGKLTLGNSDITTNYIYSAMVFNEKGIAIAGGGQILKVIANVADGGSISDLVSGGVYFEEDPSA